MVPVSGHIPCGFNALLHHVQLVEGVKEGQILVCRHGFFLTAELEQRVKIVEMLNKDGLITGLEKRLYRLGKEDNAHEAQSAA